MPLQLFEKILDEQLNTGNGKWSYRSSGNVLELLVLPQFIYDEKEFRCAVISAGQALSVLKFHYKQAGKSLFIQTFPHIENPRIICSIRFDNVAHPKADLSPEPLIPEEKYQDLDDYIKKTAAHYQLFAQNAYLNEKALKLVNIDKVFGHTYLLASNLDNPFTWLNVGYCIEAISQYIKRHEPRQQFSMFHFSHNREVFKKHTDLKNGSHLQGLIGY